MSNYNKPAKVRSPYGIERKEYLPAGVYDLEVQGWSEQARSGNIREKLVFWLRTKGTPYDHIVIGRYYTLSRYKDGKPYLAARSDYAKEIGDLFPDNPDVHPDELVGKMVRCEVVEQTKDRRRKKLDVRNKPTNVKKILGWSK